MVLYTARLVCCLPPVFSFMLFLAKALYSHSSSVHPKCITGKCWGKSCQNVGMRVTSYPVPSRPVPSLPVSSRLVSFRPVCNGLALHLGYRGGVEFRTVLVAAPFNVKRLTFGWLRSNKAHIWIQLNLMAVLFIWSLSLVYRAPARCSGGYGFDSCRGLRCFLSRAMLIIFIFNKD